MSLGGPHLSQLMRMMEVSHTGAVSEPKHPGKTPGQFDRYSVSNTGRWDMEKRDTLNI